MMVNLTLRQGVRQETHGIPWRSLMMKLTDEQKAQLGLKLAVKRQEHADLDAAISMLQSSPGADRMLIQRLKKKKLQLKDEIVDLEHYITPDIIA